MNNVTTQTQGTAMSMFMPSNFGELQRFAEIMASGKATLPTHLMGNPSDCMAIAMQAMRWGMDPFVVAQKTHLINGTLGYEAQLVNALINSMSPTKDRINYEWFGNWQKVIGNFVEKMSQKGNKYIAPGWALADERGLGVRVSATMKGESEPRVLELLLSQAQVRNSTLWASDPKQQLAYLAVKRWARLHCPEVLLGVYTPDELEPESNEIKDVTPRAETVNKTKSVDELLTGVTSDVIDHETQTVVEEINLDDRLLKFCEHIITIGDIPTLDKIYSKAAAIFANSSEHLDKASEAYSLHKCDLQNAMQDQDDGIPV
ncbi:RecT family recombinase [Thorsellia anophelis]|uniref:RecT family protein n=1 Tax=Thorsellia anophelis DSM 18579 TaxID=1123402 RepID=A0A1I0FP07_9GAMM|nr:RecT family recombinase [Thorsellia anophelis]SET60158.1 RecT family protein [Thorsellia anophelis DSM 18579]